MVVKNPDGSSSNFNVPAGAIFQGPITTTNAKTGQSVAQPSSVQPIPGDTRKPYSYASPVADPTNPAAPAAVPGALNLGGVVAASPGAAASPLVGSAGPVDAKGNPISSPNSPIPAAPQKSLGDFQKDANTELTTQAQGIISKIEGYYNNILSGEDAAGAERKANATGIALASGQFGTGTGASSMEAARATTTKNKQDINSKMATDVAGVYSTIMSNSLTLAGNEATDQQTQYQNQQQIKKDAIASLDTLAATGKSAADIKAVDPEFYQQLLNQTGYSDYQLSAALDMNTNNPNKPTVKEVYMPSADGSTTILKRITFDPKTGKSTEQDYPMGVPMATLNPDSLIKGADGSLWQIGADGKAVNVTPGSTPTIQKIGSGKDEYGNTIDRFGYFDKAGNLVETDQSGKPVAAGANIPTNDALYTDFTANLTTQGKENFDKLNPIDKGNVQQLINGDALASDIAKGMGGAKYAQILLSMAKSVDPNYSEAQNKQRYQYKVQFNNPNGKDQQSIGAINTALGHLAELAQSFGQLNTGTLKKYNNLVNWFKDETNDPNVSNFDYTLNQLSSEIAAAYKGGVPDQIEITRNYDTLSKNLSPEAGKQIMTRAATLLASKIATLGQQYKAVMGKYPDPEVILQGFPLQQLKDQGIDTTAIDKVIANQTNAGDAGSGGGGGDTPAGGGGSDTGSGDNSFDSIWN